MSKQEMIEKYKEWEENAVLMFDAEFAQAHRDYASNAFKVAYEHQQAKIDQLNQQDSEQLGMLVKQAKTIMSQQKRIEHLEALLWGNP